MSNEILIVVLLTILSQPSKEAPLRLKRGSGTHCRPHFWSVFSRYLNCVFSLLWSSASEESKAFKDPRDLMPQSPVNDGVSQKGIYTLVDGIMSLVSPNIVKDDTGHALHLRSVANISANNSILEYSTSDKKTNAESFRDLEAKDLYTLLNKIISLILDTISQTRSNRNVPPEKQDNETPPVASSSTTADLEKSSSPQVSPNATLLVTTSSTLINNGSTIVGNTRDSVSIKTARETNTVKSPRENIGPKDVFLNKLIRSNNLMERNLKTIFPRSDSGSTSLDKKPEAKLSGPDTKSYLVSSHSNSPDSPAAKKDRREARMQLLSEDVKSDSKNLEAISNDFSDIPSAPRGLKESDLLQIPKFRGSLRWNLVESDSPENGLGESNLEDQLESDGSKPLENKEYVPADDGKQSQEHYDKKTKKDNKTKPTRKAGDNKKGTNNKMCKIVNTDSTSNTEGSGDSEMNTFVCSFTIEINSGGGDSEKPRHHSKPDSKDSNKQLHAPRNANLGNKSKVGRRQFQIKDGKIHPVRKESNYTGKKQTANSSSGETPEVRQTESTKTNEEDVNGVYEKRHDISANALLDRGKDEGNQNENSNYEDEKRKTSGKNSENVEKSYKSNGMSNKETNNGKRQNSAYNRKLNNMAAGDGQEADRNSMELHSFHSQTELEDGDPSGNKKESLADEKDETNAGLEAVNSDQSELSDRNSNVSPEKEEGETEKKTESDMRENGQNRRLAKFSENMKGDGEESDSNETDDEAEAEDEVGENDGNPDNEEEVQNDENEKKMIKHLTRKDHEEMESAIQDGYDL